MASSTTHARRGAWPLTRRGIVAGLAALSLAGCAHVAGPADPLPSWNDGANKQGVSIKRDWTQVFPAVKP
jgi:hypothetical protein